MVTSESKHEDSDEDAGPGKHEAQTRRARRRARPKEIGGPKGPEPTRYGDWERNGRCSDF